MSTFWITKYALSQGIYTVETDEPYEGTMLVVLREDSFHTEYYHGEGRDWHRDSASAHAKAEKMRTAKIASLQKQIAKFEKLRFVS